jgi:PBSX family phage terminase large subunit
MPTISLFDKQEDFFESNHRINAYVGGIQSGKTTCGAIRMYFDNMKYRSPDDAFIIAADTYKTLSQASIPKFLKFVGPYGRMNWGKAEFKFRWGTTVYCRTATDPESMEGITNVRRIWVDEAGKISKYFFENCMGRAAFREAPIDLTTTPYALNWLFKMHNDWKGGKATDSNFIVCRSIDSPYFPKAEYERQRLKLDPRRFAMKYEGQFGKMEGLVYDSIPTCQSFALPAGTVFYAGVDWGYYPDPFALVLRAVTPERVHYRIGEYYKNFLTVSDIVKVLQSYHQLYHFKHVYCDPSQPAHIDELSRHGIPATGADNDIRYGIDTHYELMRSGRFWVFDDRNPLGLDEYNSYHYPEEQELEIDESRTKRETIPVDANNHGCDADRYVTCMVEPKVGVKRTPRAMDEVSEMPREIHNKIEWLKRAHLRRRTGGELG